MSTARHRHRGAAVVVLALASLGLSLANVAVSLSTDAPDYGAIHAGAVVAGAGGNPYDQARISLIEQRDEPSGGALPYVYPPTLTALLLPFGRLALSTALHVWGLMLVIAALGTVALVLRVTWRQELTRAGVAVALAMGLAFAPMRRGLELGQVDPMLALPAATGLLMAVRGREVLGGVALSALLLKPQLAALPALAVVASGRRRLVAGLVAGACVPAALVVALNSAGFALDPVAWLGSLRSGSPHRPPVVAAELVALAITAASVAVRRPLRAVNDRGEALLMLVALSTVLTAIAGPWVKLNPQSDVLLIIAAAIVARDVVRAAGAGRLSLGRSAVVGCAFGALVGDTLFAVARYNGYADAVPGIAAVVLVVTAVALARPRLQSACVTAVAVNVALTAPMIPPGYDGIVSATGAMLLATLLCWPAAAAPGPSPGRGAPVTP